MIIVDIMSSLYYDLVVDLNVVVVVAVNLVVELLGYRWGQIVNRHDVHFVVLDFYEICTLARVLLNLKRPETQTRRK